MMAIIDGGGLRRVSTTMRTFLFALLVATSAVAQPVVGPEVKSAPIDNLGDAALLPQGDGYLIAWSQGDHINVGHLDATLHETDAPFTFSTLPSEPVSFVTLATTGRSILVAWKQPRPGVDVTYAATLTPDAKSIFAPAQFVNVTPYAPAAGSLNGHYLLVSGDESLVLTDKLETVSIEAISPALSAAVSPRGEAGTLSVALSSTSCQRSGVCCFANCSTLATYTFKTPSTTKTLPIAYGPTVETKTPPLHDPIIASDGDHFLGLAALAHETDVFELSDAGRAWTLPPLAPPGIIAVAANGSDILVVWSSATYLKGTLLHSDGTSSEPFVLSQYAYSPKIIVSNSNEFVVLYRSDIAIAGRVVRVQPGRQRAVR